MICYHELDEHRDPRPVEDILGGLPNIHELDRSQSYWLTSNYYQLYVAIGKIVKPKRLMEVGVRLGYSAVSMLAGHPGIEEIVAIDNESMIPTSQQLAKENIVSTGYKGNLRMIRGQSTYILSKQTFPPFDMIHIDGEHTTLTAMLDIWSAWRFLKDGGVMLVDDVKQAKVREAIETIRPRLPDLLEDEYVSKPGWWLAKRAG